MKPEWEFYLAKFYRNSRGWRLTFCEVIRFAPASSNWALLRLTRHKASGWDFAWNDGDGE